MMNDNKKTNFIVLAAIIIAFFAVNSVKAIYVQEEKMLTVMIYMLGTNYESLLNPGNDMKEIINSDFNSEQINVVVMANGNGSFFEKGETLLGTFVKPRKTLHFIIDEILQEDGSEQMDLDDPESLSFFLKYSMETFPASDYALIIWDIGGFFNPARNICSEYKADNSTTMNTSLLAEALEKAELPKKLSWIGFDSGLESFIENAVILEPYADYLIVSELTEPASGWDYGFFKGIETDADGAANARRIIDSYFENDEKYPEKTLICIDLSKALNLEKAVNDYLADINPIQEYPKRLIDALSGSKELSSCVVEDKLYVSADIQKLLLTYGETDFSEALKVALSESIVYGQTYSDELSGLAVFYPFNLIGYETESPENQPPEKQ